MIDQGKISYRVIACMWHYRHSTSTEIIYFHIIMTSVCTTIDDGILLFPLPVLYRSSFIYQLELSMTHWFNFRTLDQLHLIAMITCNGCGVMGSKHVFVKKNLIRFLFWFFQTPCNWYQKKAHTFYITFCDFYSRFNWNLEFTSSKSLTSDKKC